MELPMYVTSEPLPVPANVPVQMPLLFPRKQCQCQCRRNETSAGALHTLPVCREQNLTNTIKYLKDCGFKIVAATEKGDYDYTKANYKDPVCIIMGAEDTGVPYEHLSLCDEWIKIPLMGKIESLNVSVAAGILIYEAVKQRGFTEDKTASAL